MILNTLRKKHLKKSILKLSDLEDFNSLSVAGFNFVESLNIIKNNKNKVLINQMIRQLDKGEKISEILAIYLDNNIKSYLLSFMKFLPFKQALNLTMKIYKVEKSNKNKVIKELKYPLTMLVTSIIALILFNFFAFDGLIEFAESFDQDLSNIYLLRNIVIVIVFSIFTLSILGIIFWFFIKNQNKLITTYVILCNYIDLSFFVEFITADFMRFYYECYKVGLKTKDTINVLKSMSNKPLIAFIANNVENSLLSGQGLKEAIASKFIDNKLVRFINLATYTDGFDLMVKQYLENTDKQYYKRCQIITKIVTIFSYLMISSLIIIVYQIILIPLSIIGRI